MKEMTVISGKGGTGKTTVTAALCSLAAQEAEIVLADCDVDASNLPLLLDPEIETEREYVGSGVAVKLNQCSECGKCAEVCRFNAISTAGEVDETACEGCGACTYICPESALELQSHSTGTIYTSRTRFGKLVHASLHRGEEASGKLVVKIKQQLTEQGETPEYALIDGSPGTGCPVIASIRGSDMVLIVTEPTLSGMHDLDRVIDLARHFELKMAICINKYDLNEENTAEIEARCERLNIPVVGKLPFDRVVLEAVTAGQTVIEAGESRLSEKIKTLWSNVKPLLSAG